MAVSSIILAMTIVLLVASHTHGLNLCQKADYPALCRSVVKGLVDPYAATESAINRLISETKHAKSANPTGKSQGLAVCNENYEDAIDNLKTSLRNLKSHDKASLKINISAALSDYVTCDDAISEGGPSDQSSVIFKVNTHLRQMASNCLYLTSLIH